jgi:hypothetical protein
VNWVDWITYGRNVHYGEDDGKSGTALLLINDAPTSTSKPIAEARGRNNYACVNSDMTRFAMPDW